MQKGSSSSKKAIVSANPQPRSQGSKASLVKGKQPYAFQNMKEFKCEIDHEIAKCLDTLDRQGLKFLKETLRASKIFGLNTQELGLTQPVQENIEAEESPAKVKEVPKKIEPLKPAVQIKKVVKPESVKKVQPVVKPTKHSQGNLNEKINKKLESLNIKTGKRQDTKPVVKKIEAEVQKVQANSAQIAQEIEVQQVEEKNEGQQQEQPKNGEGFHIPYEKNSSGNPVFYESSKQWIKNHSKQLNSSPIAEQGSLLKPFCKKQFKKHHEDVKHKDNKDYGIEISKEDDFRKAINEDPPKKEGHKVKEPIEEEVVFQNISIKEKIPEKVHEKVETKEAKVGSQVVMSESTDPNIKHLISAIERLSPGKRSKLQRIIEKLESSDKYDTSSFVSGVTNKDNEVSYQKPYIAQKSFIKNSEVKDNKSKSRSKLEKVEKATSLKSSLIKKISHSLTPQNHGNLTPGMKRKEEVVSLNHEKASEGNVLSMYDDAKSQMISVQARGQKKINNLVQQVKEKKEEPSNSLTQSNVFSNTSETGQKLIKIGKKKLQITNITFKVISNGGHNSLVGLTSILLYNCSGDIITVDETNLKSSNTKILKLFDPSKNQGWLTSLVNATISLDSISQLIGGIRIVNWNKSQLQVDRQADLMEIWINDQLHWRGQVRGGSYKENEVYATNIKVTDKHFEFPSIRKQDTLPIEERSPKLPNPSQRTVKITFDEPQKDRPEACWLQKQSVQRKLKEIEEQEKRQQKVKKISSIRNTVIGSSSLNVDKILPTQALLDPKPFDFGPNWRKQQKRQEIRYENQPKSVLRSQTNDDILLQLSKGVDARRKKEEQSSNKKKEEINNKHKEESLSKKQQDYLVQKEKEQDEEFEKILQSMEQRAKPKECVKVSTPKRIEQEKPSQNKGKLASEKNFQDFMKDSLFDDKPVPRRFETKPIRQEKLVQEPRREMNPKTPKGPSANELDNLIDELNGMVGETGQETGEQFCIPELPRGKQLSFVLISNWGHQSFIGLNGIQLFDSDGQLVKPVGVACSLVSSKQLYEKLFKAQLLTSDQKAQLKFQRGKRVAISLVLAERTEIAAIRVWNYNGHRVHSNIGVRKLHIKFDGSFIFSGQIQQSSGTSEDAYKFCEYILFTESNNILTKIAEGDWLNRINRRQQEERALFKTTLENFHRPLTRNDEESIKRPQEANIEKQPVRLPKRICFEYDPPQLPEGFVIRLAVHSSWGDRFFIGFNFIQIFNDKGENITTRNLVQVRADPSSVAKLAGYEGDRRVPANLTKGRNTSVNDSSTWLAPLLSDVERIEKGRPNIVLLQYSKPSKIAAINFYNYTKTPGRGVRQIQVFLDDSLLYRGYLRKADPQSGALHTTISFTRDVSLLQAINYSGYNQDHLQQEVALVNEERIIKAGSVFDANLVRPMTGKLLA